MYISSIIDFLFRKWAHSNALMLVCLFQVYSFQVLGLDESNIAFERAFQLQTQLRQVCILMNKHLEYQLINLGFLVSIF